MNKKKPTVLFVCTGNVCRSPMAMGLLRDRLARLGLTNAIHVTSAGTFALDGQPPTGGAQHVMEARDIDISSHRAQTVTPDRLKQADIIIVMTEAHRGSIFHLAPEALHKVLLLSELAGEHVDIPDPYGQPREAYEATARLIEQYIDRGLENLLERLGIRQQRPHDGG